MQIAPELIWGRRAVVLSNLFHRHSSRPKYQSLIFSKLFWAWRNEVEGWWQQILASLLNVSKKSQTFWRLLCDVGSVRLISHIETHDSCKFRCTACKGIAAFDLLLITHRTWNSFPLLVFLTCGRQYLCSHFVPEILPAFCAFVQFFCGAWCCLHKRWVVPLLNCRFTVFPVFSPALMIMWSITVYERDQTPKS